MTHENGRPHPKPAGKPPGARGAGATTRSALEKVFSEAFAPGIELSQDLASGTDVLLDFFGGLFSGDPGQAGVDRLGVIDPASADPSRPRILRRPQGDPRTDQEVIDAVLEARARAAASRPEGAAPPEAPVEETSDILKGVFEATQAANAARLAEGKNVVTEAIPDTDDVLVTIIDPDTGRVIERTVRPAARTEDPATSGRDPSDTILQAIQLGLQQRGQNLTQETALRAEASSEAARQDALFQNILFNMTPQSRLQGLAGLSRTIQGVGGATIEDFLAQSESPTLPSGLVQQELAQQGIISEGRATAGGRFAEATGLSVKEVISSALGGTLAGTESSEFLANIFTGLGTEGELPTDIGAGGVDFLPNVQGMLARGEISPGEAEILNSVLSVAGFDPNLLKQRFGGAGGRGGGTQPGFRSNVIRR
ncbi:hypothetical protein LCGC14_0423250 [marine sediment metagenome]|uniref:Uncharacterized protein n=1 Tax=marine sediment metagenome TaxID=412755 RepID=A0A0F9T862_9ZZZZ